MRLQIADCRSQIARLQIRGAVTKRLSSSASCWRWRCWPAAARPAQAFRQGDDADAGRRPRQAVAAYRTAVQASPDNAELQDRARARDAGRVARASRPGQRVRAAGSARGGARRVPAGERVRPEQPPGGRQGRRARSDDPRAHRSGAAAAGRSSRCASARAPRRAEPMLNPASREPLNLRFNNASLRDILDFIGSCTGINITYDREVHGSRRSPCSSTASRSSRRSTRS